MWPLMSRSPGHTRSRRSITVPGSMAGSRQARSKAQMSRNQRFMTDLN